MQAQSYFVHVQNAWATLRDPVSRKEYDAEQTQVQVQRLMQTDGLPGSSTRNHSSVVLPSSLARSHPPGTPVDKEYSTVTSRDVSGENDDDEGDLVHDELNLHRDMHYEDDEEAYMADCRCGDTIFVDEDDLVELSATATSLKVECPGCSLLYLVRFGGATFGREHPHVPTTTGNSTIKEKTQLNTNTVHGAIYEVAASHPERIAVHCHQGTMGTQRKHYTYAELVAQANIVATGIESVLGTGAYDSSATAQQPRIGTTVSEGFEAVVVMLAIWRTGAVVVPLDKDDPPLRIQKLAAEASLHFLICSSGLNVKSRAVRYVTVKEIEMLGAALPPVDGIRTTRCRNDENPSNLCHIVFTSGTTGTPKGVAVEHHSLLAYAKSKADNQSIHSDSRLLLASAFTFDPYIGDVATALVSGASLAMAPRGDILTELCHCLTSTRATHVCCTPAHWASLGEELGPNDIPQVECVALGGEKMSPALIKQWATRSGRGCAPWKFMNIYGVTEATVYQTTSVCLTADASPSVLGQPMPGVKVMLMKFAGQDEVDDDTAITYEHIPALTSNKRVVGEICLGGEQIAREYLNRPKLTASRFITVSYPPEQYAQAKGAVDSPVLRIYRTGDLGRWVFPSSSSATLEILGRSDRQVKIRGRRVELGEIESALTGGSGNGMAQSAFVEYLPIDLSDVADGDTLKKKTGPPVLVAGVKLEDDDGKTSDSREHGPEPFAFQLLEHAYPWRVTILREQCRRSLAPHMMPSYFFSTKGTIPLTRTGKLDRQEIAVALRVALHEMAVGSSSGTCGTGQELIDPIEKALATVWRAYLGVSRKLRSTDDFFRLGGDSLGALRATREFAKTWVIGGMDLINNVTDDFGNVHHAMSALVMMRNPILKDYANILRKAGIRVAEAPGSEKCGSGAGGSDVGQIRCADDMSNNVPSKVAGAPRTPLDPLDKALRDSSEHGDVSAVRALLALGVDPNSGVTRENPGVSALHAAVAGEYVEVTEMLLAAGARITVGTADLTTPVHIAAQRSVVMLGTLLGIREDHDGASKPANVQLESLRFLRIQDGAKQSLLHHAARAGNIDAVRFLAWWLKKQRDMMEAERVAKSRKKKISKLTVAGVLDPRDRWHRTPLHWAVVNGHLETVDYLLKQGAMAQPYDPHHMKRMENHISTSTHLPMETPLQLAVRVHGADSNFVKLLCSYL